MTAPAKSALRKLSTTLPELSGSTTLPSKLHDLLELAIINGTLTPGERLHADALAAHYGVSRIPVREALRSLHEAGWVDIKPRYGVRVRERTSNELAQLFEFRAVVEGQVARWAAERRTTTDLDALHAAVMANQLASRTDDRRLIGTTSAFYDALRTAAHNAVMEATSSALEKRARFYFSTVIHQLGGDWIHVHEHLLDLVRSRLPDDAALLAQEHIVHTGEAVRALLFGSD